ncbi:MAG: hypothetical protein AB7T49_11855 [Oligoflexales bacterium]
MAKQAKKQKTETKSDPFKTRKTKEATKVVEDSVKPPEEVAEAVDMFRECQEQARHFEGEATIYKDRILEFCQEQYAKRLLTGKGKSFKVMGDEAMVTYIVMDSSAGLTEEDVAYIAEKWGQDAADRLITRDLRTIRFDDKVLEAHYDEIVSALQNLDPEILENLFKPMLMKAKPNVAEEIKKFAKNPEEIREILSDLKVKHYIK